MHNTPKLRDAKWLAQYPTALRAGPLTPSPRVGQLSHCLEPGRKAWVETGWPPPSRARDRGLFCVLGLVVSGNASGSGSPQQEGHGLSSSPTLIASIPPHH